MGPLKMEKSRYDFPTYSLWNMDKMQKVTDNNVTRSVAKFDISIYAFEYLHLN